MAVVAIRGKDLCPGVLENVISRSRFIPLHATFQIKTVVR